MLRSLVTGQPRPSGSLLIVRESPEGLSMARSERRWLRVAYGLEILFVLYFGGQMIRWAL
jgi:hypothetical protein